ncbi:hypothetical protein [Leptospira adleri]|uniref:hypothetical protein n=1 Tax=Leptospira adleri TaxID=2023186 RepID=UPI0010836143|nr:hypothetical protein [Leptospira adleri]TGM58570.1 hypothetical protein EHQ97_05585 [Leptospira adleri]
MEENTLLKALYYQKKLMVTQFYKLNPENSGLSVSYVYAISHDCYPTFHSDQDSDLYNQFYEINKETISKYLNYIDERWLAKDYITFYELESHFGGKENRIQLMTTLRYCFLDNRFSHPTFWETLHSAAPIEATALNREIDFWDI